MTVPFEDATKWLAERANLLDVRHIAEPVLSNPKFPLWTGASKPHQHHYGKGLLAVHTAEVTKIALDTNRSMGFEIDPQKLFLSCLYHDVGKMWDYKPKMMIKQGALVDREIKLEQVPNYDEWEGTDHKRKIYHIQRSALVWNEVSRKLNLDDDFVDDITHAILAHHGMPEWGSPVGPNTKLAWLVHLSDNISARMYDCDTWDITKQ